MIHRIKQLTAKAIEHKGLRKYGANMSWLFIEKAVRMVIGFTVGIYVARQLGPAKYGILNYAISFAAIFSFLVSLGMDQIMVRELVKFPEKRDELMGTSLLLRLAGYIIMLGGIWGGLALSNNDMNTNLIILVIAAGYLFQIFQTIDFYFQAHVLSKYVAISQMTAWIIVSALRAVFAYLNLPLLFFAYLEAGNIILTSLGYLIFYILKADSVAKWRYKTATAKFLLKNSWPLMLSSVAIMIYMRIDQIMIKAMIGAEAVGQYAVAVRLCEIWYILPGIIVGSLFPAIIRSREVSESHYKHRLQMLFSFMIWSAIAISAFFTFAGEYIIIQLYGHKYSDSALVFRIYTWVTVFVFYGTASGKWIINEQLQRYALYLSIMGCVTNVILNYILISRFMLCGAAAATLISYFIATYFGYFCIKKLRNLFNMFNQSFNISKLLFRR
jgi:O-antigen/teichoic acid export membrane protein